MAKDKSKKVKTFTCKHGKGKVTGGKCSVRKKGMCPKGHPCKRI
jgi:hypothetical protein